MAMSLAATLAGCMFTGVENTARVSDKEVARVITEMEARQPAVSLTAWRDSMAAWRVGKRFFVTDNQARLLFDSNGRLDSLCLQGRVITFSGLAESPSLTAQRTVDATFSIDSLTLVYHTARTIDAIGSNYSIPLLVDLDMVDHVARQIVGRKVYVKTPIWYDLADGEMRQGLQMVPVTITRVEPGNKVLPLKVTFATADSRDSAFVWMSQPGAPMHERDFDSMFALSDPHINYPAITDATWALIQHSQVVADMTKQECQLALGAPKRTAYVPDQAGMREYWYYDGGAYLYFVDGRLKEFRK